MPSRPVRNPTTRPPASVRGRQRRQLTGPPSVVQAAPVVGCSGGSEQDGDPPGDLTGALTGAQPG